MAPTRSVLAVTWDDGRYAEIDLIPIIAAHPALAPLAEPDAFMVASEDGWSVEWPAYGVDFGAAKLRRWEIRDSHQFLRGFAPSREPNFLRHS